MSDKSPIDFYFDFSSPYAYIAAERIEAIAAKGGRTVRWCPTLLGVVFKQTGLPVLVTVPVKGDYSRHDFVRSAHFHGLTMNFPKNFPIATVAAARAALMLRAEQPERVGAFIKAVFRAFFVDNLDITLPEVVGQVAQRAGFDADQIVAANNNDTWKEALKGAVQESVERKVFGAPFVFVDGEPFWGNDRLDQVERWVTQGPF